MSITRHLRRAPLWAIACALLLPAAGQAAPAVGDSLAKERYYMSFAAAQSPAPQEQYLSSYGAPEPLTPAQSPSSSDGTPWLPIGLSLAGALAIVAVSTTQLRRVRVRRRRAVHTAA